MKARRFNYFTVVLISGNENQESYSWYKCKNNRKWAQFPGGKEKKKKNTMTMNNEARQENIIYINESDGGLVLIRESYTGGRSPLSLFMGLGSWRMCHASSVRRRYMCGSASTTVASSQAMLWWWFIACSAKADIQGSPFVSALLCSLILICNVRPISHNIMISSECPALEYSSSDDRLSHHSQPPTE